MPMRLFTRKQGEPIAEPVQPPPGVHRVARDYEPAEPSRFDQDPLRRLLQEGRFGFIALNREKYRDQPDAQQRVHEALELIDERFAMVPEGFVSLPQTMNDITGAPETDFDTKAFLLNRHCVTNAEYQLFVDSGGYSELELWPQDIWPHLIDFKDQTEHAGPRFWREGRHDKPLANHPVVGICYYEAAAYADWVGFRLPTEAEWQMAASWRIRSAANVMRRYPWGDALDTNRCNIWASNVGHTLPVDDHEGGMAPNGVKQLGGNVWEWTDSDFEISDDDGNPIIGDMLMKSIRGGAFDTYFAAQATSTFRTGAPCIARVHNVGFRLATDLN